MITLGTNERATKRAAKKSPSHEGLCAWSGSVFNASSGNGQPWLAFTAFLCKTPRTVRGQSQGLLRSSLCVNTVLYIHLAFWISRNWPELCTALGTPQTPVFPCTKIYYNQIVNSQSKERILKAARVASQVFSIRLTASFSSETMQDRRQWTAHLKSGRKDCQLRTLYLTKLSFKNEEKNETFQDKVKHNLALAELPYKK